MLALTGSAAAATFLGTGSASAQTTPSKYMLLDTTDTADPCNYVVEASEAIEVVPTDGNTVSATSGTRVEGTVDQGYVAIKYAGWISTIEIDGRAYVRFGDSAKEKFPDTGREISITSPTEVDYQFTATENIERVDDGSKMAAETNNDTITQNDDGTVTANGFTGNTYGDCFMVYGDVTEFTPLEGDYTLTVDGQEMTAYELTGQEPEQAKRLQITSPTEVSYTFTVTDGAERVRDGSKFEAETNNDTVTQNSDGTYEVSGLTGNGYGDSYDLTGDVTSFSPMEGDFTLTYDGQEVTAYELTGQEPPADGPVIGGGDGYQNTVPESAADVVASTKSELNSALLNASSGDVVYVSGDADIDMGTSEFTIPSGVTLASDRGIDGAPGGRLYTSNSPWGMLKAQDGARVTGLRVEGPRTDWYHRGVLEQGIVAEGDNVEIDNVEAYNWGWACVRFNGTDGHAHHNHIHGAYEDGSGYGVATTDSDFVLVEYNHFDTCRHSVESTGGSYTARYNHITGETISHHFDVHPPGGVTTKIHHNTVEPVAQADENKDSPAVAIRETPSDVAYIHHNWFYNPNEPRSSPSGGWDENAIIQVHVDSWQNVEFDNNHYGSSAPSSSDVGCPGI